MAINSHFIQMGASSHSLRERQPDDFYSTDPVAVHALLEKVKLSKDVLEPSCGNGNIAKVLQQHGHDVEAFDLRDRGFGRVQDFMQYSHDIAKDVVMNPPFKHAKEHIMHALELMQEGGQLCAFLKIQFLESVKRKSLFDAYPLKCVYVFRKRINCWKNDNRDYTTSSPVCYAWYVWQKGYTGSTTVDWIDL